MTYKTAYKLNEVFVLDKDFNIFLGSVALEDSMAKGYVYANLFFYDETQKEIDKLRALIEKIHDEVVLELNMQSAEPPQLLLEISTRAHRAINDDGLDSIIKEFLSKKSRHMALITDQREQAKFMQICEAIFMELTATFYNMTMLQATDLANNVKMFKFTNEYVASMTERQRNLVVPALRVIGLENSIKLNNLLISSDFTVKYSPEPLEKGFAKQEETIKDQIKTFIQSQGSQEES